MPRSQSTALGRAVSGHGGLASPRPAGSRPDAQAPDRFVADTGERTLRLLSVILLVSLLLQRFGLISGSSYLSIVGPIGLALAAYGLARGLLVLHRARLMIFMGFVGWIVAGAAIRMSMPISFGAPSWPSLLQFVSVTSFATLVVRERLDEARFFRRINAILMFIAIAGTIEFIAQFAGISLFSFHALVPDNLLLEGIYNTSILIGDSGYLKSNGLFLVEPSVFSQFMALAIIIEMLVLRRPLHLAVFAAALVESISGTGWLMIISFVITAAFSLGARGLVISVATLGLALLGLGTLALIFPSGFDLFMSRTGEIYEMGSSGHLRFVTPWWLCDYILSRDPWAALTGIGAGVSEHLAMPPAWDYNINTPVKLGLEYGAPCFALYIWLLLTGRKTVTQKALVVPILVMLLFDGGYTQFAAVLFPLMLLIITADLIPTGSPSRQS